MSGNISIPATPIMTKLNEFCEQYEYDPHELFRMCPCSSGSFSARVYIQKHISEIPNITVNRKRTLDGEFKDSIGLPELETDDEMK